MFGLPSKYTSRPLDTFNFPPSILTRLVGNGFAKQEDLADLTASDLVDETGMSAQEAVMVLEQINSSSSAQKEAAVG
jgi:hypothetical protein